MEGSHETQLPVVDTPTTSLSSSIQSAPAPSASPARRPGRFLVFRRAMRLLFRRWLYVMTLLFRWMRPVAGLWW
jgi:hypothetical protein